MLEKSVDTLADNLKLAISKIPNKNIKENSTGLPPSIRQLTINKRKIRKNWQKNRCPLLKKSLNKVSNDIQKEISSIKAKTWDKTIEQISSKDNKTNKKKWDALHKIMREKQPKEIGTLKSGQTIAKNDTDKLKLLGENLSNIFCGDIDPPHFLDSFKEETI